MPTVWDAMQDRLKTIFAEFDNVTLSFSGGKDSGVMLNAALDYMRRNNIRRKITVVHIDYEAGYTATADYVAEMMTSNLDLIDPIWICLPIAAGCSVTMTRDHWLPWAQEDRDLWVFPMPEHPGVIHEGNVPDGFPAFRGIRDYAFQARMSAWLHRRSGAKRTAVMVGIREQESLHRWAAIHREDKRDDVMYQALRWTSRIYQGVYNVYPVHDWLTEDVWVANAKFGWSYNRLYDLMALAGVPLHSMRVSSPFHQQALDGLRMFRLIEPALWPKIVGRVNGVNFTAIYAGTSAMGAGSVALPEGHTWKSYVEFLLSTLPPELAQQYQRKFDTSLTYWRKGGALPADTVAEIRAAGIEGVEFLGPPTDNRKRVSPAELVAVADYPDDIPGVTAWNLAPTWKRMAVTILRNDVACKTMGFGQSVLDKQRRNAAIEKYRSIL